MKLLTTTCASLCAAGLCQAATISIDNFAPQAGTFSGFTVTAIDTNTFNFTNTADLDGGGLDDTLSFTLTRTTYTSGTISGADVTVGTENTGGNTVNWYSSFNNRESLQLAVTSLSYTSGEADGTTAVFDGFQAIARINVAASGSVNYLLHTGDTGSTTVASTGAGDIALTSLGDASSIFITAEDGAGTIRLRNVDLQFSTVAAAVPEPSSTALLGLGGLALILRRRK